MGGQQAGVLLSTALTTQDHKLGAIHITPDGTHLMFLQADGAVLAGQPYSYDASTFQIEDLADAAVVPANLETVPICVSPMALADNEYGWVVVGPGSFSCLTDATGVTAAGLLCYISATVGTLTSGATAAILQGVRTEAVITGGASGTFYATVRMYAQDLP